MKYLLFLSVMVFGVPLAAQNECLICLLGKSPDNAAVKEYELHQYIASADIDNNVYTGLHGWKSSYSVLTGYFGEFFEHLGLKETYKETKLAANKYIRDSGKNTDKQPWIDLYDNEFKIGIRITWDRKDDYQYVNWKIWRDGWDTPLPWCDQCEFTCNANNTIITKYEAKDFTKLVGFQMNGCDIDLLRTNSGLEEISPMVFSNSSGTFKLSFSDVWGISLNSLEVSLGAVDMNLPKGVTASSNLNDLETAFGIPYGFDGINFEVVFGPFEATDEAPRFLATFVLNQDQSAIKSFMLKSVGSIRNDSNGLDDFNLEQEQKPGCIGCIDGAGTYKKFYFSNGYSFYDEIRNNRPYKGQVYGPVPLPNNGIYSLPDIIEKERLANRTEAEILADEAEAKVKAQIARSEELNKKASDQLVEYIENMRDKMRSINANYEQVVTELLAAYQFKEYYYRYEKNASAMTKFDLVRQRAEELRAQVATLGVFIKKGQVCSGSDAKLDQIDKQGSRIINFYDKTFKALWKTPVASQLYLYNFPEDQLKPFLEKNIDEMKPLYEDTFELINDFEAIYVNCR